MLIVTAIGALVGAQTAKAAYPENVSTAATLPSSAIYGIHDYEIFQRDLPQNVANISVELARTTNVANTRFYSVSLLAADNTRQTVLAEGSYSGNRIFSFALPPQSKFRKIRISFYDAKGVERQRWNSPSFNVGEVFLVTGQSNAGNYGDTESTAAAFTANPVHRAVDPRGGGSWLPLQGPLPYTTSWAYPKNGSPWPSFADALGTRLASTPRQGDVATVPVAVLNVSYGGSSLEVWDPSATADQNGQPIVLFNRLTLAASVLKRLTSVEGVYKCGFRAVLWHQGESNSNRDFNRDRTSTAQEPSRKWYAAELMRIAQSFKNSTSCAQPWMVATASWLAPHWRTEAGLNPSTKFAAETEIREAQLYLANRAPVSGNDVKFVQGPDTDLLAGDYPSAGGSRGYRHDGLHMSLRGLVLHGQLWALRVANLIDPVNQQLQSEKDLVPQAQTLMDLYLNELSRTPEEVRLDNEGMRYWVQTLTMYPGVNVRSVFQTSDEKYVRDSFQRYLNRRPTFWEVSYWTGELAAGRVTRSTLLSSSNINYENTLSAPMKKAYLLYAVVMGRTPPQITATMGGLNYWANVLGSGAAESLVADSFRASAEYRVRAAFVATKRRQPSMAELDTYMPMASSGGSDAALAAYVWKNAAN